VYDYFNSRLITRDGARNLFNVSQRQQLREISFAALPVSGPVGLAGWQMLILPVFAANAVKGGCGRTALSACRSSQACHRSPPPHGSVAKPASRART